MKNKIKTANLIYDNQYFIFDMDGVVINIEHINFASYKHALKRFHGILLTKGLYAEYFRGRNANEGLENFLESYNLGKSNADLILGEVRDLKYKLIYNTKSKGFNITPGFISLVSRLREMGKKIGLATMTRDSFTKEILKKTDLIKFFDVICSAEHAKSSKPNPEIFITTLEKLGTNVTSNCVIFEDSIISIINADKAGFKCILVGNKKKYRNFINIINFNNIL